MSAHVSGYMEPLIGEASCFDIVDFDDNRNSNEKTLKMVLEIEKIRQNFVESMNLTVKSIKNNSGTRACQQVINTFEMMNA